MSPCEVNNQSEVNPVFDQTVEPDDGSWKVGQIRGQRSVFVQSAREFGVFYTMGRQVNLGVEVTAVLHQRTRRSEDDVNFPYKTSLRFRHTRLFDVSKLRPLVRAIIDGNGFPHLAEILAGVGKKRPQLE